MWIGLTESDDNRQKHRCPEGDLAEKDHDLIDEVNGLEQGVNRNPCQHDDGRANDDDPSDDRPATSTVSTVLWSCIEVRTNEC